MRSKRTLKHQISLLAWLRKLTPLKLNVFQRMKQPHAVVSVMSHLPTRGHLFPCRKKQQHREQRDIAKNAPPLPARLGSGLWHRQDSLASAYPPSGLNLEVAPAMCEDGQETISLDHLQSGNGFNFPAPQGSILSCPQRATPPQHTKAPTKPQSSLLFSIMAVSQVAQITVLCKGHKSSSGTHG